MGSGERKEVKRGEVEEGKRETSLQKKGLDCTKLRRAVFPIRTCRLVLQPTSKVELFRQGSRSVSRLFFEQVRKVARRLTTAT